MRAVFGQDCSSLTIRHSLPKSKPAKRIKLVFEIRSVNMRP